MCLSLDEGAVWWCVKMSCLPRWNKCTEDVSLMKSVLEQKTLYLEPYIVLHVGYDCILSTNRQRYLEGLFHAVIFWLIANLIFAALTYDVLNVKFKLTREKVFDRKPDLEIEWSVDTWPLSRTISEPFATFYPFLHASLDLMRWYHRPEMICYQ